MIQLGQTTAQLTILQFDPQPKKRRPVGPHLSRSWREHRSSVVYKQPPLIAHCAANHSNEEAPPRGAQENLHGFFARVLAAPPNPPGGPARAPRSGEGSPAARAGAGGCRYSFTLNGRYHTEGFVPSSGFSW